MRIHKFTAMQCPGIEDQIIRSYDSDFKSGMIDDVLEATDYGVRLSASSLSRVASGIIRPIGSREESRIDQGWRQSRFKIALLVEVEERKYHTQYCYIVGYTDTDEGIVRGDSFIFDPDTRIYFNTITRLDMRLTNFGNDRVWQPSISKYDQILRRDSIQDDRRRNSERPSLLRPTDLFRRKDHAQSDNAALRALQERSDIELINNTGRFVQSITLSNMENNLASQHLNRSLNALVSASTDPVLQGRGERDDNSSIRGAVDRLNENVLEMDPFLDYLRRDSDILRSGYITYDELMSANPDFDEDDIVVIQVGDDASRFRDSARWDGDAPEQLVASIIANGLPSIMLNSMYSMADFLINTTARLGEDQVELTYGAPFMSGLDPRSTKTYFTNTVEDILLREASNNGMIEIIGKIQANIDEEIEMWITVDGGDEHYFVYPTWGSGLLSPVLSADSRSLDRVSNSITGLATSVSTERNRRYSNHVEISDSLDIGSARRDRDSRRNNNRDSGKPNFKLR